MTAEIWSFCIILKVQQVSEENKTGKNDKFCSERQIITALKITRVKQFPETFQGLTASYTHTHTLFYSLYSTYSIPTNANESRNIQILIYKKLSLMYILSHRRTEGQRGIEINLPVPSGCKFTNSTNIRYKASNNGLDFSLEGLGAKDELEEDLKA